LPFSGKVTAWSRAVGGAPSFRIRPLARTHRALEAAEGVSFGSEATWLWPEAGFHETYLYYFIDLLCNNSICFFTISFNPSDENSISLIILPQFKQ
jgi:hypothetical protein